MLTKEQGEVEAAKDASEEIIYRIDIPANRYDLLCLEGLVNGLLVFLEKVEPQKYIPIEPKDAQSTQIIKVLPETAQIRQFVVGAVLRNITFNQDSYNSFIDLQDKLHHNICRKRTLVSVGTHDLDTVQGPFTYEARKPEDIKFIPLNQTKEMNGVELMEHYSTHAQLKQFLPIIKDSPVYPVIYDSNGIVLSLPPIINGDHSKITLNTKNVFIEVTSVDLTKAKIVLDTIVCMFSTYCKNKFSIEKCKVISSNEEQEGENWYPTLNYWSTVISPQEANAYIGINESPEQLAKMLTKMYLNTELSANGDLVVEIPPIRHDVLFKCDIFEDIGIAYGYNNIKKTLPNFMHIAKQFPLNKLTDQLREHTAQAGFNEALTFTLCSRDDISTKLNKNIEQLPAVHIGNPKTLEFQIVRTTLIPGLLKTLAANRKMPLPMKLFEISDVVLADKTAEVECRNERRFCAVNSNKTAGFEVVHGLLDRMMLLLEVPWKNGTDDCYYLEATDGKLLSFS